MRVLMVGCGKMGGAMMRRWSEIEAVSFTVVDPALPDMPDNVRVETGADALGPDGLDPDGFDVIVLAVKPQMIRDVAPLYRSMLRETGLIASIAAGTSIEQLKAVCGPVPVVRIMPNLPAQIGRGVIGLYGNGSVGRDHRTFIDMLAGTLGLSVWVESEDELDRLTAVAGSGPGYVFEIAREYIAAAKRLGFDDKDARDMVLNVMGGAIEMALASDEDVETLRNNVTSKNGTTEAGLNELMRAGALRALLSATTEAAYARAVELR